MPLLKRKTQKQTVPYQIRDEGEGKEFVKQHIGSIPPYVSHYGEKSSNRRYLEQTVNLQKRYPSYVAKCRTARK